MIEQGTPEWLAQRMGKVTASRIADVMGKTKSGWGAGRANYAAQLIAERLTGIPAESYTSPAMQWGLDTEAQAKDAYSFFRDADVLPAGFVEHPVIVMSGASPDGFVGDSGLLEVKCPNTATHIDTLLGGGFPGKYHLQAKWQMACTGRKWCDLASFDPRMPEDMRLHVERVVWVDSEIAEIEGAVRVFLQEVATKLGALTGLVRAA
jgi:putative phage-type endonuclease